MVQLVSTTKLVVPMEEMRLAELAPINGDEGEGQGAFDYDVFLSYSREDDPAPVQRIVEILIAAGLRVFMAPEVNEKPFGLSLSESSLDRSRHYILYWTKYAGTSRWIQAEYEAFFKFFLSSHGARKLITLLDSRESVSSLPELLQKATVVHSIEGMLADLGVVPLSDSMAFGSLEVDPPLSSSQIVNSPSVSGALSRATRLGDALSFALARQVLQEHREYGDDKGADIGLLPGPPKGISKPADVWLAEVKELFDPERVPRLHGRLLILGLAHLDPDLAEYLEAQDGFLSALRAELKEPFESLLLSQAKRETPAVSPSAESPPTPPPINDPTPLHLDSPAVDDRLGRRGFARALAIRLERIWHEMNPQDHSTDRPVPQGSFVLHLHGPWGSGKSSILEMLRRELQPEGKTVALRSPRRGWW